MKNLICLILAFQIGSVFAQRTPWARAEIELVSLPTAPLPLHLTTYHRTFAMHERIGSHGAFAEEIFTDGVGLHRFSEVASGGHLELAFSIGVINVYNAELKSETKTEKNREGQDIQRTYYWYEQKVSGTASLTLKRMDTEEEYWSSGLEFMNQLGKSNRYSTRSAAQQWLSTSGAYFTRENLEDMLKGTASSLQWAMNRHCGYNVYSPSIEVLTAAKRRVDYTDLDALQERAVAAYESLTGDYLLPRQDAAVADELRACIAAWAALLEEYEPGNRRARINDKVAEVLYRNMAMAHLILDEHDRVEEYIALIREQFGRKLYLNDMAEVSQKRSASIALDPRLSIAESELPNDD